MPNGGSDCCGTCRFNATNEGAEWQLGRDSGIAPHCVIRELDIHDPFWTYCANHPHHNPRLIEVPIGPVFINDGYPYTRRVWREVPDSEDLRRRLLGLLAGIKAVPEDEEDFQEIDLYREIIKQVMKFGEERAIPHLRALAFTFPSAFLDDCLPFERNWVSVVALAVEALGWIEGDGALDDLARAVRFGLEKPEFSAEPLGKQAAAVRYHAVLGLAHCRSPRARQLLEMATNDLHPEVAVFAMEILKKFDENRGEGGEDA